jgi:serine/alanine adding enzyme
MNYRVITEYESIDKNKWSEFVNTHPTGSVFQTPEMYEVYNSAVYYTPIIVVCIDESNAVCGLILSVIQKEYRGLLGKLSSRSIIWGAPLIKENDKIIFDLLMNEYDKIAGNKAVYTQIRNLWDTEIFKAEFERRGYIYEDHLDILVDLNKSEDTLWSEVYARRRSQINKSERKGVIIKIFNDTEFIEKSYNILKEVYKRAKLPLPGKDYFVSANRFLGGPGFLKFFGAFYEERLIGVMYLLCYNDRTYEWYIGSYLDYMRIHPNDLIIWEIFKWSKENGYKIFDFGGAGRPDREYGVREYKKKFGGTTINLGRYQKTHSRLLMYIAIKGFKFWQFIKFGSGKS